MSLRNSYIRKNTIIFLILFSLLPFVYLFFFNSGIDDTWYRVANLSGFVGTVLIIWQFILGVRGFSKWISNDYDWVIKIHTYLGVNGAIFVILHPLLESIVFQRNFLHIFQPNFSNTYNIFLSLGKIGFVLYLVVWASSSLFRRLLKYRDWLHLHYLSYLIIFFVLIHPLQIGSILNSNFYVFSYWIFLCIVTVTIIFFKILDTFNVTFKKYKLTEIKSFPGDIFTLKYKALTDKNIQIKPGQYFYIKNKFIGEAHPYSVLEFDEETGDITFGIKKFGKFSISLSESKEGDTHYIDGPFGEFTFEGHDNSPKVILAGGVGITPFYELVTQFGNEKTFLFYANKNTESALYRENFKKILGKNYFDFVLEKDSGNDSVFCELISTKRIKELLKDYKFEDFKFFICGSPIFTNSMIKCLKDLGISRKYIYIEEFEY